MILYVILSITALYVIFVNLPQVYQFADLRTKYTHHHFETDVFYSLCPKVENFQVCNMQDIGGFAICGLIKRKESQLTIQKRGSSSMRVVAARQTEEGQIAGARRSSSLLRE